MKDLTKQTMEAEKGALHKIKRKERTVALPVTLPTPGFPLIEVKGQLYNSNCAVIVCCVTLTSACAITINTSQELLFPFLPSCGKCCFFSACVTVHIIFVDISVCEGVSPQYYVNHFKR